MRFDLPTPDTESAPYWEAAREGILRIRSCNACQHRYFYPRDFCPRCWSEDVRWIDASGRATLYTYSVVHVNDLPPFPEKVPYAAAIVELEEGPRMMTNVVNCDLDSLAIGMALTVTFHAETEDVTLPMFEPAQS